MTEDLAEWSRQRLAEWAKKGVKRVIFDPAPDCCDKCEALRGEYEINKAPILIRDTHEGCRCSYTMNEHCFD